MVKNYSTVNREALWMLVLRLDYPGSSVDRCRKSNHEMKGQFNHDGIISDLLIMKE